MFYMEFYYKLHFQSHFLPSSLLLACVSHQRGPFGFSTEHAARGMSPAARITRKSNTLYLRWMPSYGWIAASFLPTGGQNHKSIDNACPLAFGGRVRSAIERRPTRIGVRYAHCCICVSATMFERLRLCPCIPTSATGNRRMTCDKTPMRSPS